jgi:hypothetical protein
LTQILPVKEEILRFADLLLNTFGNLGIGFVISGTYPAYLAGMFTSF